MEWLGLRARFGISNIKVNDGRGGHMHHGGRENSIHRDYIKSKNRIPGTHPKPYSQLLTILVHINIPTHLEL